MEVFQDDVCILTASRVLCAGVQTKEELTKQLKGYSEIFGQEVKVDWFWTDLFYCKSIL